MKTTNRQKTPARKNQGNRGKGRARITKQQIKLVVLAVAQGCGHTVAARIGGISARTIRKYIQDAKEHLEAGKTDTPEVEFYEAIELAEAQAIHHAVKMIHDATPKDWRAAAWILERLEPERWNLSKRFEHSGPDGTAIETTEPGPVIVNLIVRRPEGHEDEVPPFTFADHSEVDHLQK